MVLYPCRNYGHGRSGNLFLFAQPNFKTKTDVIIVKAVEKPFKIKPTEPGGKIVDHQNLLIVDILKGSTKEADKIETLRPSRLTQSHHPLTLLWILRRKLSME